MIEDQKMIYNHRNEGPKISRHKVGTEAIVRYWGRKPRKLAESYIRRYTKANDVVADYFGGSGVFVKSAVDLGRRAIYVDLNPFAHLVAKSSVQFCDAEKFLQQSESILHAAENKLEKIFFARCKCGNHVDIHSIVYNRRYRRTKKKMHLNGKRRQIYFSIPSGKTIFHDSLVSLHPKLKSQVISSVLRYLIKEKYVKEYEVPIELRYLSECKCGRTKIHLNGSIPWIRNYKITRWTPHDKLEYSNGVRFLKKRDVESVNQLFTKRNLTIISEIWHQIQKAPINKILKNSLALAFMATIVTSSKMTREGGGSWPINCYWIPREYVVKNPFIIFKNASRQIYRSLKNREEIDIGQHNDVLRDKAEISFLHTDSTRLALPRNSLNYVIIDPPHTDEAQFFELSVFYTSWLRKKLNFRKELIINEKQGKDFQAYLKMLQSVSLKIHSALKKNGKYTTILHGNNRKILDSCMETICDTGFKLLIREKKNGYTIYTFKK